MSSGPLLRRAASGRPAPGFPLLVACCDFRTTSIPGAGLMDLTRLLRRELHTPSYSLSVNPQVLPDIHFDRFQRLRIAPTGRSLRRLWLRRQWAYSRHKKEPVPGKASCVAPQSPCPSALPRVAPATPFAGSAWDEIRAGVFAGRTINPAGEAVVLTAPFRPLDQRAVPIEVEASFADGRTVRAVTIIVDQNPTPVAARFDIGGKREHLKLVDPAAPQRRHRRARHRRGVRRPALHGRPFRQVRRRSGRLLGAAVGQPGGDRRQHGQDEPRAARKRAAATQIEPRARLKIMHPNHTGMVLDQLTLLYVPLRIVTDLEVRQGDERVFAMQGSIAMAQNPVVEFDYRTNGAETLHVEARDTRRRLGPRFPRRPGQLTSTRWRRSRRRRRRRVMVSPTGLPTSLTRQRRDVGDRAVGRIGLILADNAVGLPAPVLARDGHCRTELHAVDVAGAGTSSALPSRALQ